MRVTRHLANEALTSAVLEAQIGEAPNVSESDGTAEAGEHEVESTRPVAPVLVLVLAEVHLQFVAVVTLHTQQTRRHASVRKPPSVHRRRHSTHTINTSTRFCKEANCSLQCVD